jgi:FkbM family methyltransferase
MTPFSWAILHNRWSAVLLEDGGIERIEMLKKILRKLRPTAPPAQTIVPRGADLFADIERCFPGYAPGIVLDVGANIGQTTVTMAQRFPSADIYSLEPFPAGFAELKAKTAAYRRIRCCNLACGASPGVAVFRGDVDPTMGRLDFSARQDAEMAQSDGTQVKVTTVDVFCGDNRLKRISFLKIDTEGGDLDVLRGAEGMLAAASIDFVEVEAGMNRDNHYHVPMFELVGFMENKGYRLFGLYEQIPEWPTGRPFLRRANLVFLSPRLAGKPAA